MRAAFGRRERPSEETTELVYLPVALASPRDRGAAAFSKRKRLAHSRLGRGGPGPDQRLFVVERVLGHGWAVSCDRASLPAADGTLPARHAEAYGDGERTMLPARLSTEECRRSIEAVAARAAFAFGRGRAADVVEIEALHPARYPFLLRYQRKRSGAIDFEVLDAVTGRRAGGPLRAAIAAALIDADQV